MAAHPLNLFHTRPQGLELSWPEAAGWRVSSTTAYANSFAVSDLTAAVHVDDSGAGASFAPSSARRITDAWPERAELLIDTEVVLVDVEVARRFGNGITAGARLPWWRIGGTGLDPAPSSWHRFWGIDDGGRELFPYGDTVLFISHDGRSAFSRESPGSGIGNLGLWIGWELPAGGDTRHRVWLAGSLPTAGDTLLGDQGWDWGPRWSTTLALGRTTVHLGAGWTFVGGTTPTTNAADTWHAWAGLAIRLFRGVELAAMIRGDGSPYRGHASGELAEATGELAIGPSIHLGESTTLQVVLGEDVPGAGLTPDFSVQARLLWRLPAR